MVTAEAAAKAWIKLDARWGTMLATVYPKGLRRDDFQESLRAIPVDDCDLLAAVEQVRNTRETLYPHDNLPAILRKAAEEIHTARKAAEARAEGERRHQLALEEVKREKAAMYLAGATLDQKPGGMTFGAWLDQNAALLASTDDPLEIAMRMVGGKHTMDDRLRESIIRLVNLARDKRPPAEGYGTERVGANWYEKDGA